MGRSAVHRKCLHSKQETTELAQVVDSIPCRNVNGNAWSSEATALWQWFEGLQPNERAQVIACDGSSWVALLELMCEKDAAVDRVALFEWSWLEHQHELLSRRMAKSCSKGKHSVAFGPMTPDPPFTLGDNESGEDDWDPMVAQVSAGMQLIGAARLLTTASHGWEAVTLEPASLANAKALLRALQRLSANQFLMNPPPHAVGGAHHPGVAAYATSLRASSVHWLQHVDHVHSGALLGGAVELSLWRAFRTMSSAEATGASPTPSSRGARAVGAMLAHMNTLATLLHSLPPSRRDSLLGGPAHAGGEGEKRALHCLDVDAWVRRVCFPPLQWCVRRGFDAHDVRQLRLRVEEEVAEVKGQELLSEPARAAPRERGGVAAAAGADSVSEARRLKRQRQAVRRREQSQDEMNAAVAAKMVGEVIETALIRANEVAGRRAQEQAARARESALRRQRREQGFRVSVQLIDLMIDLAVRDARRRERKREKSEARRARLRAAEERPQPAADWAAPSQAEDVRACAEAAGRVKETADAAQAAMVDAWKRRGWTPMATHVQCAWPAAPLALPQPLGVELELKRGAVISSASWLAEAVKALLAEMEQRHAIASEGERAARRVQAIEAAEAERQRRLGELEELLREESARREISRAAACNAAEGERRRRLQIVKLEEEEERRVRQLHRRLAIEAMEAERDRRVLLQLEYEGAEARERQVRQQRARIALEQERTRRVRVLRQVEEDAVSASRVRRLAAILETEQERQRRMYELAAAQWEMAKGVAKLMREPPIQRGAGSLASGRGKQVLDSPRAAAPADHASCSPLNGSSFVIADETVHHGLMGEELSDRQVRQLQWAAFASGVALELSKEEQAERSRRRQWAAAALQFEHTLSLQLSRLSVGIEVWCDDMQRKLQPLEALVWRTFRRVCTIVQAIWAEASVEMFGSWASGLQLSYSDVDLAICGMPSSLSAASALEALAEALLTSLGDDVLAIKRVFTARVPVIKVNIALPPEIAPLCATAGLVLDISLDSATHSGMATTRFTRDACASHAILRPSVLVLKHLVASAGLSSGEAGGLSSYALVLMATSLLQMPSRLGGESHGAGPLLFRFLQLFGAPPESRDGTRDALHAVLLDGTKTLQTKPVTRRELGGLGSLRAGRIDPDACGVALLVQDPLVGSCTVENNVAIGAFNFHHVQSLLRDALARLEDVLQKPPGKDPVEMVHFLLS